MKRVYARYKAAVLLLCLLSLLCCPSGATASGPVLRNGIYIMQMSNSDMTAAAASGAVGSPMILWPYRPTATWEFRHVGKNVYTVRTNSTLLDGGNARSGKPISISRPYNGDGQKWKLKRVGAYYQLINMQTGLAMKLGNGQRTKGSRLVADTPRNSQEQLFCIQRPRDSRYCGGKNAFDKGQNGDSQEPSWDDSYQDSEQENGSNSYINAHPKR